MDQPIDLTKPPQLRVVWPEGSYESAILQYELAKLWLLNNGLCFDASVAGIIHSPRFHGEKSPGAMTYENGWMQKCEQLGWACAVDVWCIRPERLAEIAALTPPDGATLERLGEPS